MSHLATSNHKTFALAMLRSALLHGHCHDWPPDSDVLDPARFYTISETMGGRYYRRMSFTFLVCEPYRHRIEVRCTMTSAGGDWMAGTCWIKLIEQNGPAPQSFDFIVQDDELVLLVVSTV